MSAKRGNKKAKRSSAARPHTLAIDIGGSHVKASVLDASGKMIAAEVYEPTSHPMTPRALLGTVARLADQLPAFDRISAGFPGYVKRNVVYTAPNLGTEHWREFGLADALAARFGKPARILNDADVQGLGVIAGKGFECVLTLGTGIGSSFFYNGRLLPHLELGQHPVCRNLTYDRYIGDGVRRRKGRKKWNKRLEKALMVVTTLVNYDMLYLGGGNAQRIDFKLPRNVKLVANIYGITGGVHLWKPALDELFTPIGAPDARTAARQLPVRHAVTKR
jgi:polyphosphate glucokinase